MSIAEVALRPCPECGGSDFLTETGTLGTRARLNAITLQVVTCRVCSLTRLYRRGPDDSGPAAGLSDRDFGDGARL